MLTLTGRLDRLAEAVADLGLNVALHFDTTAREINWRLTAASPLETSPVNASGTQISEELAIRDIINAAHEQLWSGITLSAGAAAEPDLFEEPDFPAPTDKMADWVDVQAEEQLTTEDLLASNRTNSEATEDAIRKLSAPKRRKFTELLNVELAELQQERSGPREDLKREGEIEALLGLFARVGEM